MSRPFKVLGIQQIAIGAVDKSSLKHLWVDLFGLDLTGHFLSEKEKTEIIAFLKTLKDMEFIYDRRFVNPFTK